MAEDILTITVDAADVTAMEGTRIC